MVKKSRPTLSVASKALSELVEFVHLKHHVHTEHVLMSAVSVYVQLEHIYINRNLVNRWFSLAHYKTASKWWIVYFHRTYLDSIKFWTQNT